MHVPRPGYTASQRRRRPPAWAGPSRPGGGAGGGADRPFLSRQVADRRSTRAASASSCKCRARGHRHPGGSVSVARAVRNPVRMPLTETGYAPSRVAVPRCLPIRRCALTQGGEATLWHEPHCEPRGRNDEPADDSDVLARLPGHAGTEVRAGGVDDQIGRGRSRRSKQTMTVWIISSKAEPGSSPSPPRRRTCGRVGC